MSSGIPPKIHSLSVVMDLKVPSSSLENIVAAAPTDPSKAGRRRMRHPVYRGVRRRNSGKWVSEVRDPNKASKIWLGTFPNPEMAAAAYDTAVLALHGAAAPLNFPVSAHRLPRPASSSHQDIQRAALQAARDFTPSLSPSSSASFTFSQDGVSAYSTMSLDNQNNVSSGPPSSSNSFNAKDDRRKIINVETSSTCGAAEFVDEEAIFNMPLLLDSMAQGMLLTPPAMKKGFSWSQEVDDDIDLTLWGD